MAWTLDTAHTTLGFEARHMGLTKVRGQFDSFRGEVEGDPADIATARGRIEVDTASIDTGNEDRDAHLRSPDFFDVAKYPTITFASTSIARTSPTTGVITGDLTMHGVTGELTLQAEITGTEQDPYGNDRVGLEVTGELDRGEYGMSFNQVLGSGNALVSDKVKLHLDISAVKQS